MPSTRDLHPSIIQSRSREPCRSPSTWNIRVCESAGALHEPSGGTERCREGMREGWAGRDVRWFASEPLGSCRESSRKSVKARDTFRMRSHLRNITIAVDGDSDIFTLNV